jgi:hypothetical protein
VKDFKKACRSRLGDMVAGGAIALCLAAGVAMAMPVETGTYAEVSGVNDQGELDIREVLDNATEMDVRLTKQIMLLQRQLNVLKEEIEFLRAER